MGILASIFSSSAAPGPPKPWEDPMSYPAINGVARFFGVTFANFNEPCSGKKNYIFVMNPKYMDILHPSEFKNITLIDVGEQNKVMM